MITVLKDYIKTSNHKYDYCVKHDLSWPTKNKCPTVFVVVNVVMYRIYHFLYVQYTLDLYYV